MAFLNPLLTKKVFKFCFNVKHVKTSLQTLEILREKKHRRTWSKKLKFLTEKCKNEFPGLVTLKKHLRKVHEAC